MKKKIVCLILCLCLSFSCLVGCSLVTVAPKYTDDTVIAKIYGKEITYGDLEEKYDMYSQYFAYYDEDVVMKIIYDELYLGIIEEIEAEKIIKITAEDQTEILDDIMEDVVKTINGYEKTFIENAGKDVPERLNTEEETNTTKYEAYEFELVVKKDVASEVAGGSIDFNAKLTELKNKIFDGVEDEFMSYRTRAYEKYVSALMKTSKLAGNTVSADAALKEKLETLYESHKKSKMLEKYKEYVESCVFESKTTGATLDEQVADVAMRTAIVEKYKELLNASKQKYSLEDNYTEVIFSTSNTDLVLYHNEGTYNYFTVQHILVKFDDETINELKQYEGYDKSKDAMFRAEYEEARHNATGEDDGGWKYTIETSYRDDEGNTVYVQKLDEFDNPVFEEDENGDPVLDENGDPIPVYTDEEAKITLQQIYENFVADRTTALAEKLAARKEETGNDSYTLTAQEKANVSNTLFLKYVYRYTGDNAGLGSDKLIETLGYGITDNEDEDGGLMSEFADAGRSLYTDYINNSKYLGEEIVFAETDYGVHMMVLTNVFSQGEIVSTAQTDAEIIDGLKTTLVSTANDQTLLEFVYEKLKTDETKNYFSNHLYGLLDRAKEEGKFKELKTPEYEDLKNHTH